MMPCILIGDSIAVGVGQARPECETVAQVGISSERYVATMLPPGRTKAETAVISLGVNDDASLDTIENLRIVRGRIAAQRVVWLLPGLKENVRAIIRTVAAENGDRTVDTRPQVGRDHLHPNGAGYEVIAGQTIGPSSGVEVAYAPNETVEDIRRPLRTLATPRERIHRLRAMRHAEVGRIAPRHGPHAARPAVRVEKAFGGRRAAVLLPLPLPPAHARPATRTKVAAVCAKPCREKVRAVRS